MSTGLEGTSDELDCGAALEQLHDYLKRELTQETAGRIQLHLERCAHCFQQLRFAEEFFAILQTHAAGVRCPDTLRTRIADALRTEAAGH